MSARSTADVERELADAKERLGKVVIENTKLRYLLLMFAPELRPAALLPHETPMQRLQYMTGLVDVGVAHEAVHNAHSRRAR